MEEHEESLKGVPWDAGEVLFCCLNLDAWVCSYCENVSYTSTDYTEQILSSNKVHNLKEKRNKIEVRKKSALNREM